MGRAAHEAAGLVEPDGKPRTGLERGVLRDQIESLFPVGAFTTQMLQRVIAGRLEPEGGLSRSIGWQ